MKTRDFHLPGRSPVYAREGMAATSHPLASLAAIETLKAGGTGLNLTAATHVIHFDRWWNPAVENQATKVFVQRGFTNTINVRAIAP